jgi:serine/threonine protein phosphatase PrpC
MECPHCTATLPDDDIFCEECGVRLLDEAPQKGGCRCGAGPDEIDEDGFCGRCGIRVRPRPEDHIEIVVSPDLAGVSDRGIRHERNEDRVAVQDSILVVCDGVSSSGEAQTAAAAAVDSIREMLGGGSSMEQAFAEAARRVAELDRSGEAPSTTAVAARVENNTATIGWVGDSRAYWIESDGARQLTSDHSWLNDVVSSGEMSMEEAVEDSRAHAITRWLGGDSEENARPDTVTFPIPGPGVLLLCSDGLWNYAPSEREMGELFARMEGDAIAICRGFVEFAKERGGQDNVTAAVLRFGGGNGERIQG